MNCVFTPSEIERLTTGNPIPSLHPMSAPLIIPGTTAMDIIMPCLIVWALAGFAIGPFLFKWADKANWRTNVLMVACGPFAWLIWLPVWALTLRLAVEKRWARQRNPLIKSDL